MVATIYDIEEQIKKQYPTLDVAVSGNLISTYHNLLVAEGGIKLMIPVMFALMFFILGILLRSISTVVISLIIAVLASVGALGLGARLQLLRQSLR